MLTVFTELLTCLTTQAGMETQSDHGWIYAVNASTCKMNWTVSLAGHWEVFLGSNLRVIRTRSWWLMNDIWHKMAWVVLDSYQLTVHRWLEMTHLLFFAQSAQREFKSLTWEMSSWSMNRLWKYPDADIHKHTHWGSRLFAIVFVLFLIRFLREGVEPQRIRPFHFKPRHVSPDKRKSSACFRDFAPLRKNPSNILVKYLCRDMMSTFFIFTAQQWTNCHLSVFLPFISSRAAASKQCFSVFGTLRRSPVTLLATGWGEGSSSSGSQGSHLPAWPW